MPELIEVCNGTKLLIVFIRIKYYEWDMESETRLRVAIKPKHREIIWQGSNKDMYLRPDNKYLYAKLPLDCFESMTITLSPFCNGSLKEEVEKLLLENGFHNKVKILDSCLVRELQ